MMEPEFAKRLRKIKEGVQDLAELELSKAVQVCEDAEARYLASVEQRRHAQASRNDCRTGAEFQVWQGYVRSLEALEHQRLHRLHEAQMAVTTHRDVVTTAYQDVRRWEIVEGRAQSRAAHEQSLQDAKMADESAVLKFGRGSV